LQTKGDIFIFKWIATPYNAGLRAINRGYTHWLRNLTPNRP